LTNLFSSRDTCLIIDSSRLGSAISIQELHHPRSFKLVNLGNTSGTVGIVGIVPNESDESKVSKESLHVQC
jgi:hypothetical protein